MDTLVIGIDEVGRGCWAGPLVVGAVMLNRELPGLTDSKLLSKLNREKYAAVIRSEALFYGLGWVWPNEIDVLGLTRATTLAIERAITDAPRDYPIIIDGSYNYLPDNPLARAIVKADLSVPSVSAGSVIAKVARDDYMAQQSVLLPGYGFEKHVGYGTAIHKAALVKLGVSTIHRRSYKPIQQILAMQPL